jgi:hypothetical protein
VTQITHVALADAAEAGHGLAWLPCWLIRDRVRSGTLIPLLRDVPSIEFVTYALWPQTPHLPLRVRFALDALTAALPGTTDLEVVADLPSADGLKCAFQAAAIFEGVRVFVADLD